MRCVGPAHDAGAQGLVCDGVKVRQGGVADAPDGRCRGKRIACTRCAPERDWSARRLRHRHEYLGDAAIPHATLCNARCQYVSATKHHHVVHQRADCAAVTHDNDGLRRGLYTRGQVVPKGAHALCKSAC